MSTNFTNHVFAIVDKRDATGFAALFAPHGRFAFGNADPIVGPAPIAAAVQGFFDSGHINNYRIFVDLARLFEA